MIRNDPIIRQEMQKKVLLFIISIQAGWIKVRNWKLILYFFYFDGFTSLFLQFKNILGPKYVSQIFNNCPFFSSSLFSW